MTDESDGTRRPGLSDQIGRWPVIRGFNAWCDGHRVLQWIVKLPLILLAVILLPITLLVLFVLALVDEARGFGWKGALLGYSKDEFAERSSLR
ncbi:MAG: hypothetical protein Q7V58_18155 [Actinomycetota bacterium]|nr:hypothetical protein [Actinomycetota bacterium]